MHRSENRRSDGRPTPFQVAAVERLRDVLRKHGIVGEFQEKPGKSVTVWTSFLWQGDEYDLAIFEEMINMREGGSLFECYLSREFVDADALVAGFAGRLDRYLSGGPWEEADESEPGRVARFFRWLLTRRSRQ